MTKDDVLAFLWRNDGAYVSGAQLARSLGISRTAVWKAMEQLRSEGYDIESVTNKGYRLTRSDVLSEAGIRRYLKTDGITLQVHKTITSTNTVLKALAAEGAEAGLTLVAAEQTAGRGRMGRQFYSPADSGIYLSMLLKPQMSAGEATNITACAAVAVAEAIEELSGLETKIKWVNDVLVAGKKVCGILTEASMDWETGTVNYVVVGIGINLTVPEGDFPEELRSIAGAVFGSEKQPELRCRIAAAVIDRFMHYYRELGSRKYYDAYKARSSVLHQPINILAAGKDPVPAEVLDIEPDFALRVRLADGSETKVLSGEVSIRAASRR